MQDYRNIRAWQESHKLALLIYKATNRFPDVEKFGLTSQIRRSAISIPSNIAEGSSKFGDKDFAKFLQIALGSAAETEYLLFLAFELKFIEEDEYQILNGIMDGVKRIVNALLKKVRIDSSLIKA